MSLQGPYRPPQYAADAPPIPAAYAWIAGLAIDFVSGGEVITVHVHPDAASAAAVPPRQPLDRVVLRGGQVVDPGDPQAVPPAAPVRIARLDELMTADPTLAQAFGYIRQVLYGEVRKEPRFAGAVDVP